VSSVGDWSIPEVILEAGIREVFRRAGIQDGEISITFLDDPGIRDLNRDYLGRDHPTDVIAFTLNEPGDPPLGDVYVGYLQARRQAAELGIHLDEELVRLAIHGALHVLGHDHPPGGGREKSEMFQLQEEVLNTVLSLDPPSG
jgi:probable rRNA maturation factor